MDSRFHGNDKIFEISTRFFLQILFFIFSARGPDEYFLHSRHH